MPEIQTRQTQALKTSSAALALVAGVALAHPAVADDLSARLDQAIDHAIAEHRVVGTVVLVMQDGRLVYHRAAGLADREAGRPMREDAIFRLASVSKPFVTTAALALVDRGVLRLDDPVAKWLPGFRPRLADGTPPTITVRQLMTHTAGLTYGFMEAADGPYHRAGVSDGMDQPGLGFDEELRRIASAPLSYPPGTSWGYSVAIDVLGAVVERASGKPLPETVADLVTRPLGIADTGFALTDPARLATAYADGSPDPVRMGEVHVVPFFGLAGIRYEPSRIFDRASFPSGGAGMVGTASDVLTLLEAIRAGGQGVVRPETAAAMMTDQVRNAAIMVNAPGWGFGYGGSVLLDPKAAETPQPAGTWTWGGAYGANWFVDPRNKLVVVAMTNTAIEGMIGAYTREVRDAVYGAIQASTK